MNVLAAVHAADDDVVAAYARFRADNAVEAARNIRTATGFLGRFGSVDAFAAEPLDVRLSIRTPFAQFVSWLLADGRLHADADYLVARPRAIAQIAKRCHPIAWQHFEDVAVTLGFGPYAIGGQWSVLCHIAALYMLTPDMVTYPQLIEGRDLLLGAARRGRPGSVQRISTNALGLEATVFHAGWTGELDPRRRRCATPPDARWEAVTAGLATTMRGYVAQLALTRRPKTVQRVEVVLRDFACHVSRTDPDVSCVAEIRRHHVETWKLALANEPGEHGDLRHSQTIRNYLGVVRGFFAAIIEQDHPDAPARSPIYRGDVPLKTRPLPRFLDDGQLAQLLRAARADPDPFVGLCVEFLARTGLRKSEFVDLRVDAAVQIGTSFWLHVPVGKLRTDRYIPLHPRLKQLLDERLADRPTMLRSDVLFVEYGRPIGPRRVDQAIHAAASRAGLGRVTPHQLRHTLATQAINRGMSIEAIAALLGHSDLSMTLVYARIANRTVADQYFKTSAQVDALYDGTSPQHPDVETPAMTTLRQEMNTRLLGNGYCNRPTGINCSYETICETCVSFVTNVEFLPTLKRQRDDAANKDQTTRRDIFDTLIGQISQTAS